MPCFSQQSETCFQSETSPGLKPLYCSFLLFFLVVVFLFLSLSPFVHPFLQMRLDEDRPAFINHPLKRNPWRSIINDLATNFEEVPRPNVTRSVEHILRFEIRARLTRNRRPDSLTIESFLSVASVSPWYVYTLTQKFGCKYLKICLLFKKQCKTSKSDAIYNVNFI